MRVLIVNQHLQDVVGGTELQCHLLAGHLTSFGHEVVYGAVRAGSDRYDTGYRVIPIRQLGFRSFAKILKETRPDLVYWRYNKKWLLMAGLVCRLHRVRLVFTVSSIDDVSKWSSRASTAGKRMKQLLSGRLNYLGYHLLDGIVCVRKGLLEAVPLLKNGRVPRTCIYNSMSATSAEPFHWHKPYVVWVANLKRIKNPELYVQAARRLHHLPVDFLMVGRIQDRYYAYLENRGMVPDNLHYLGAKHPEEVNSILANSLFLVSTCNPEGFSNNLIQSWLQGKPVVSLFFDPDGCIVDQGIGYCSGDFDMLCQHITDLVLNVPLRTGMGSRAAAFARRAFAPDRNIREYERFFQAVVFGQSR